MKRVRIHIDRLVLRGFQHGDRQAISEALKTELGRMIVEPELAQTFAEGGNIARMRLPDMQLGSTAKAGGAKDK